MLGSFSGKVAKQINRQGYPERLANATQQAFLQVAKKTTPKISDYVDRLGHIESINDTTVKKQEYLKLHKDVAKKGDATLQNQLHETIAKSKFIHHAIQFSEEFKVYESELKDLSPYEAPPADSLAAQVGPEYIARNFDKFRTMPLNKSLLKTASDLTEIISNSDSETSDKNILQKKLQEFVQSPVDSKLPFANFSYNEIKQYTQTKLFESFKQAPDMRKDDVNSFFGKIRNTTDGVYKTTNELKGALNDTYNEYAESTISKIKEASNQNESIGNTDYFKPLRTLNDAVQKIDKVESLQNKIKRGAISGVDGSSENEYLDKETSFENLEEHIKYTEDVIDIERQTVPKPDQILNYAKYKLSKSLEIMPETSFQNREIIQKALEQKPTKIGELNEILYETYNNLSENIAKEPIDKNSSLFPSIKIIGETADKVSKISQYYSNQIKAASLGLSGSFESLYDIDESIQFSDLEKQTNLIENRTAIQKKRGQSKTDIIDSTFITNQISNQNDEMCLTKMALEARLKETEHVNFSIEDSDWNTKKLLYNTAFLPSPTLPKNRTISREEEQRPLPKPLEQLLEKDRTR